VRGNLWQSGADPAGGAGVLPPLPKGVGPSAASVGRGRPGPSAAQVGRGGVGPGAADTGRPDPDAGGQPGTGFRRGGLVKRSVGGESAACAVRCLRHDESWRRIG